MKIIDILHLIHEYKVYDDDEQEVGSVRALNDVTLSLEEGSFVVVLGHNGCGKSTLAKHLNALLLPTEGMVYVCGNNTQEEDDIWKIRKNGNGST